MTKNERDEAIRVIKSECYISNLLNLDRTRMVNTALDKAVEALKAEPCEDCISREDVLKEIDKKYRRWFVNDAAFLECILIIKKMSHVTPARKKGEWIAKDGVYGVAYCSECDYEMRLNDTNYCPNCGAKMEVEE